MPGSIDHTLRKARSLARRGAVAEAAGLYRDVLARFPGNTRAREALAALEAMPRSGNADPPREELAELFARITRGGDESREKARRLVARYPASAASWTALGLANAAGGDHEAAEHAYRKALGLQPAHPEAHNNLGILLAETGRDKAACAAYREAIRHAPHYTQAHSNLAGALRRLGHLREALASSDRALELARDHAEAWFNRGNVLGDLGRQAEAVESYTQALRCKPGDAHVLKNMGNALAHLGRRDAACAAYRDAIAAAPDDIDARMNLGRILVEDGEHEAACRAYEEILERSPGRAVALERLLALCTWNCDWTRLAGLLPRVPGLGIESEPVPPFVILALEDAPARHRRRAERFAGQRTAGITPAPINLRMASAGRQRIGYFSADFHQHAVMTSMVRLFELHDRSRFEVHAYSFGPDRDDAMRRRIRDGVDVFHDLRDVNDDDATQRARGDGLDIAVDLSGYTTGMRPAVFARRAAPLQISCLGYPGTSGAEYIDYLVADRFLIPDAQRGHYSERILYLPHSFQPNDDTRPVAEPPMSRTEAGLPEDGVVFCCFNNSFKISEALFDLWMQILRDVEGSVLWLLGGGPVFEENLRRAARDRGVVPDRLVFAGKLPPAEHLARLRLADLFLDTFAYNAGVTASDALWAGLPVLTMPGEGFAARMAGSLLHAAGMPELAVATPEAYRQRAVELAAKPARLQDLRERLDAGRARTPLFDSALFARHFEAGVMQALDRRRAGRPLEDIIVTP